MTARPENMSEIQLNATTFVYYIILSLYIAHMDDLFKELNVKLINVLNRACPFIKKYSRNILNINYLRIAYLL